MNAEVVKDESGLAMVKLLVGWIRETRQGSQVQIRPHQIGVRAILGLC
jgi:hypothetical protein